MFYEDNQQKVSKIFSTQKNKQFSFDQPDFDFAADEFDSSSNDSNTGELSNEDECEEPNTQVV